jgi:hypothetical protein
LLPQASKLGNAAFLSPTGFLSHQVNGGQFLTTKNFVGFPDMMGGVQPDGTPGANGQSAQVLLVVHDVLRFKSTRPASLASMPLVQKYSPSISCLYYRESLSIMTHDAKVHAVVAQGRMH